MARLLGTVQTPQTNPVPGGRPLSQPTTSSEGLFHSIWDSIVNVPGRFAASGVNLATTITQGKEAADIQARRGVDIPFVGNKKPIGQTGKGFVADLKDALGVGLEGGAELATVATAPASLPATIAIGAGIGATSQAGRTLQQDKSLLDTAVDAGVGALSGGIGGAAAYGAGKVIQAVGEGAYKFIIPRSMQEAKLLQAYKANVPFTERVKTALVGAETTAPRTAADTAFEKGLVGTEGMIGIQAKRASTNIWDNLIGPKLDASSDVVNIPSFFNHIEEAIIKDTPELSRQKALIEALSALREDYAGVENISMKTLQKLKEGWAKFIPDKTYQGKPIAGAFRDIQDRAADLARTTIYKSLGKDSRIAYFDYGNLKGIEELGQKAMTGGRFKGGFGGFWSGVKDEILTPVFTVGGQTVYKTGQGVEFVGKRGAKVLADLFSPTILKLLSSDTSGQQAAPK